MKIQQQLKGIVCAFLLILCVQLLPLCARADETEEVVKTAGFTKKVKHPENQVGSGEALDLMMKEGQVQQVAVEINNLGDKELDLAVSLNGARTNGNGGIEYGRSKFKKDKSMKYDLVDLVEVPKHIKIPSKAKKDLIITIKMPKIAYKGIIMGGIELQEAKKDQEEDEKGGTMVVNKVAYLFGVTLRMSDEKVKPHFKAKKAYAGQQNYRNAIFVDVANVKPIKAEGLVMDTEIVKKGKTEVLYESKKNNIEMAPNTVISYPVPLNGEKMNAGTYIAHIHLDGYGKEWKWDKEFQITDEEADKFNQQDVNIVQERGVNWKLIICIVSAVLIVLLLILLVNQQKKKRKNTTRKKHR